MTKPSLSWIEPQTMARLLARAHGAPSKRPPAAPPLAPPPFDAGRSDALAGPPSRTRTLPPPMLPAPSLTDPLSSSGRLPDFICPPGGLEDRLQAYLTWVHRGVSPITAFVADESGLPVVALGEEDLVAVTAPCMATFKYLWSLSGGEPRGRMILVVDQDRQLHIAEAASHWGRFNISILTHTAIPDATMITVQRGLVTALSEPGEEG